MGRIKVEIEIGRKKIFRLLAQTNINRRTIPPSEAVVLEQLQPSQMEHFGQHVAETRTFIHILLVITNFHLSVIIAQPLLLLAPPKIIP